MILVDPSQLNLGDIEDIEDTVGMPISQVFESFGDGTWTARMFASLAWVTERKNTPEFTLDDARQLKLDDITFPTGTTDIPLVEAE